MSFEGVTIWPRAPNGRSNGVEDYEDEFRRLRDEHAEIVCPDKRLWFGVAVLIAFAGLGVAWPTYSMSIGSANLTSVRWFVWPFCGVLAGLHHLCRGVPAECLPQAAADDARCGGTGTITATQIRGHPLLRDAASSSRTRGRKVYAGHWRRS